MGPQPLASQRVSAVPYVAGDLQNGNGLVGPKGEAFHDLDTDLIVSLCSMMRSF